LNSFGQHLRCHIFGESHGPCIGITLDGCPAGLPLSVDDFFSDMERRKGGIQKGTTPRQEDDIPQFLSGWYNGFTTGAPLTLMIENKNTRSEDYAKQRSFPRPGHADWVAGVKYGGFEDYRGGGHFSGRLTAALVAAGVIAKKLLSFDGIFSGSPIEINASITEIGGQKDWEAGLQKAIEAKDSVGGIVECRVKSLPAGLGEHFFDSVESLIAHAVFSIPAIRGIEFGTGFAAARMFGSAHNDALLDGNGNTQTNHAGGIIGGLTNGQELVFRIAVKPTSSTPQEQKTWNRETDQVESFAVRGRHDLCIALRVPVVLEAVTALVLADLMIVSQRIPPVLSSNHLEK